MAINKKGEYPYNILFDTFRDVDIAESIPSSSVDITLNYMRLCSFNREVDYLNSVFKDGVVVTDEEYHIKVRKLLRSFESVVIRGFYTLDNYSLDELEDISISKLHLDELLQEKLVSCNINSVGDLVCHTEKEMEDRGFNKDSINQIMRSLKNVKLTLRGSINFDGGGILQELLKQYPYNLALDVFGDAKSALSVNVYEFVRVFVDYEKYGLTERERDITLLRYQNGCTYDKIATHFGLSRERIRQILGTVIRKVERCGISDYVKTVSVKEFKTLKNEQILLEKEIDDLVMKLDGCGIGSTEDVNRIPQVLLEDLELSYRTKNCLIRQAGKKTIGDVAEMSIRDLQQVRNMGKKSIYEILHRLKEYGIELREV